MGAMRGTSRLLRQERPWARQLVEQRLGHLLLVIGQVHGRILF